jgi:hypothetical protein
MAFPASAGVSVELGGPGIPQPGIVGQAGDRFPRARVRCPPEVDPAGLARSTGDGRRAALGGGLFSTVDPIQDRADLGQQLGARISDDSRGDEPLSVANQPLQVRNNEPVW